MTHSFRTLTSTLFTLLLAAIASPALAADSPEISRSRGVEGGVVVLWPRVIPRSQSAVALAAARTVQQRLSKLAAESFKGRELDVRPEPERVCGQAGCLATAVGAVVVHNGMGCAVVVTVSPPGQSAQTLVPWVGRVDTKQATVPFRQPPESYLSIRDFERCDALFQPLEDGIGPVEAAVAAALGVPFENQPTSTVRPEQSRPASPASPSKEDVGWP